MLYNKNQCFSQGEYRLENPSKYTGKGLPIFRSSWERRWMYWADTNKNIIKWCSECIGIKYFYPIDQRVHTYFPDMYIEVLNNLKKVEKYVVEIKPKKELSPPIKPKNKNAKANKRYLTESAEYVKNIQKWEAAKEYCKQRDLTFKILTEDELF
jgi:hypothetical protein